MLIIIPTLIFSALLIYFSCELFVNGIEWVGRKYNIADNAVGTVLAAFGTALPESIVTFIAVVFGVSPNQKDIGVGAALGGPLILSTLAYAIVGLCMVFSAAKNSGGADVSVNGDKLSRDQFWFLCIFVFNTVLGFLNFPGKMFTGLFLFAAYGLYCFKEMRIDEAGAKEALPPLILRRKTDNPETGWVLFQTFLSLSLIFIGSQLFVSHLELFSASSGAPAHIISLILSPIATELPEIINAIIWVRQGKTALALSNVSGSMMVQATIPSGLGIMFTPWLFDSYLAVAVFTTLLSVLFLWVTLKNGRFSAGRLSFNVIFYLVFLVAAYFAG